MKIYIVRHGITVWNELKKVQGCADIHLAPQGRSLAEKTGEALRAGIEVRAQQLQGILHAVAMAALIAV